MPLMETLAKAQAVAAGRAQPLATVRHRWLSDRPLVFVPLTTAGEVGAPLGALVGTERDAPHLLVVPQPRDRDLRSAFLAALADEMLPYLTSYEDRTVLEPGRETDPETGKKVSVERELCEDAPQLIVPNPAGVEYVRLLGRATRFRRTAEEDPADPYPAPSQVPLLGRWLTHYGERARTPGSALLLAMTELLSLHWATGQSGLEDQHLGALLAWLDPPQGVDGAQAALRAQVGRGADGLLCCPPAGPATDPVFDNTALAPAIDRYDAARSAGADTGPAEREIRALLTSQLRPTWDDVWRGIDLLRALPPGGHVEDRWKRDRWSYTGHRDRLRAGEPPQPRVDDAVTAAQKLSGRETAQARLDAQEALDDPLVMAGRRLAGEAFAGEVTAVEMAYSDGKVPRPRPLLTVATDDEPHLDEGGTVYRALPDGRTQEARFTGWTAPGVLRVQLLNGMGRGKVPDEGSVPEVGDRLCWTLFEHAPRGGPELPDADATPWTHGGPPSSAPGAATHDPVTSEDYL
ncbi:hypothetical protein ACFOSC_16780 [Streptantibioticus rubrisoli]|uniref:Uncharacterized protein n=1 Tax=Streptantibioticus rubrisoli TaxID=1387313 RepID=A0ABT1PR00_9ACTN|nr:hypothetical protein [Streptantibioticus rubrisoli]MCQ4046678.1 hypothetical protein [Streptantibioticus rubrisoli]